MKKLFLFGSVFLFVQSLSAQGNGVIIRKNEKGERETEITTKNNTDVGPYTLTRLYKDSYLFMDSLVMGAVKLHNNKVIVAPVLYNLKTKKITPQIKGKVEEFYDTYFSVGRHKFTYINGHYYEIAKDRKIKF